MVLRPQTSGLVGRVERQGMRQASQGGFAAAGSSRHLKAHAEGPHLRAEADVAVGTPEARADVGGKDRPSVEGSPVAVLPLVGWHGSPHSPNPRPMTRGHGTLQAPRDPVIFLYTFGHRPQTPSKFTYTGHVVTLPTSDTWTPRDTTSG